MNLLNKYIICNDNKPNTETDSIDIFNFRKAQYNNLKNYIKNIFDFLYKISSGYIELTKININKISKYFNINGSKYILIDIYIKNVDDSTTEDDEILFTSFYMPDLVDDNFFYISGCTYCPALYILDYPIVYKESSIKLTGLINSMTIYLKPGCARAIFCGKNIPIQYFLQYFLHDNFNLLNSIKSKYKIEETIYSNDTILSYFSNLFNCRKDRNKIDEIFNDLFFDEYTKKLYSTCYNTDFDFNQLILYVIENYNSSNNEVNFIDLRYKRLIFIEQLLYPFFKKISDFSLNLIKGYKNTKITFSELEIIKFFTVNLKHQFYYDLVNLYSGISIHKASFMNPNSTTAPKEISSIHESHFGKICPATVSAQKPGETVSIIPGVKLDLFGRFL